MKTGKRMMRENVSAQGKINTDKFMRAMMPYHNMPIPDIGRNPAQMVFNRPHRYIFFKMYRFFP